MRIVEAATETFHNSAAPYLEMRVQDVGWSRAVGILPRSGIALSQLTAGFASSLPWVLTDEPLTR